MLFSFQIFSVFSFYLLDGILTNSYDEYRDIRSWNIDIFEEVYETWKYGHSGTFLQLQEKRI